MSPTSYQTAPSRINNITANTVLNWLFSLVRKGGLEPPRPKALPPQGSVSTNSTTTAALWEGFYSLKYKKESIKSTYSVVFGAFGEVSGDVAGAELELCADFKL